MLAKRAEDAAEVSAELRAGMAEERKKVGKQGVRMWVVMAVGKRGVSMWAESTGK